MRRSSIALCLALAFPAVFAQSRGPEADESLARGPTRLELYGVVDGGLERVDIGSQSVTRVQSGISAGSRLGFRGSEILGNPALRAVFVLESRLEIDTGSLRNGPAPFTCGSTCPGVALTSALPAPVVPTVLAGMNALNTALLQATTTVNSAGALFDRQAFAGLVTPFGAFLLGRQYTPGYEIMNRFNAFADATAGQFGQGYSALAIRTNNAIQYRAELGGVVASLMYSLGGSEGARNERSGAPQRGDDFMGGNLQYHHGRFSVGAGYNRNNVVTYYAPTESRKGLETTHAGATFNAGPFKLFGMYMGRKNDNPVVRPEDVQNIVTSFGAAAAGVVGGLPINAWDADLIRGVPGRIDTTIYHLGAQYQTGPHMVLLAYNNVKDKANDAWDGSDAKVDHAALAYFYSFSKRTQAYGAYAIAQNKDSARMALGSAGYAGGFTTAPGEDSNAIQLGIRHSF
jgi:predicted porin